MKPLNKGRQFNATCIEIRVYKIKKKIQYILEAYM